MGFEFESVYEVVDKKRAERIRKIRILQWVLAALIVIAGPATMWYRHRDLGWDKFDSRQWEVGAATLGETERGSRSRMVPDLMANYLKPGITRKEVRALLGAPDFVESSPMYEYQVARNRGFRLAFDREGYFTAAALVRY